VPGLAVNWGAWAGAGMAAHAGLERMERLGFGAIQPAQGAAALGAMLRALHGAAAPPQLLASVFFWERLKVKGPVFEELKAPAAAAPPAQAAAAAAPQVGGGLSVEAIQAEVLAAAAGVLGLAVSATEPLVAAGLDSLGECRLATVLLREILPVLRCGLLTASRALPPPLSLCCRRRGAAQRDRAAGGVHPPRHPGL
jgi:hypothetical protein